MFRCTMDGCEHSFYLNQPELKQWAEKHNLVFGQRIWCEPDGAPSRPSIVMRIGNWFSNGESKTNLWMMPPSSEMKEQ